MTMHKITEKLRKKNKDQYRLLGICIFLSMLLVSSFAMMFFSPSIQEALPPGGDTRKLMWLMLVAVAVGCLLFTLYGSSLFFRQKSREFGVMLALGAEKKELSRQLFSELRASVGIYILSGLAAALPVSYLIWLLFRMLVIDTQQMQYRFGIAGVFAGLLFAVALSLCILFLGIRFIRRADIMEILNAGRKTEIIREISPWSKKLGILLIVSGLFLAMAVPQLTVRLFRQGMPAVWNLTWLVCAAGLYLVILSAVGQSRKGKHPETYYSNIISTNLMRFAARQTTRNMCVISLLVFVIVLSAFWGVMYYYSVTEGGSDMPYDYSLHYPAGEAQMGEEEIRELAEEYGVEMTSFEELDSLELVIRYTGRDMDEQRRYFDVEYEKLASFVSASDFARISGSQVTLGSGEYRTVAAEGSPESFWTDYDCLNAIRFSGSEEEMKPRFMGTVECGNLNLVSDPFAFVLADEDYRRFAEGISEEGKEKHILFNVKHVMETYDFADALKQEMTARATATSNHYTLYDAREEELALAEGRDYSYAGEIDLSPDNPRLIQEWKYAPFSKVLLQAEAMEMVAVFVLLSIYVSAISLTAAGMMSYVRSITIAMDNRQLFEDLKKLGADRAYVKQVIRVQLRRIFAYPVAAGGAISGGFSLLLTYFNDMSLQVFEVKMLMAEILLMAAIVGVMYGVYRGAYRTAGRIAGI